MKRIITLFIYVSIHLLSQAQGGTWTWMKGDNFAGGPGNIGTMGVTNSANYPDGRYQAINWIDHNGNLWMFGGLDNNFEEHNDLWEYNTTANTWTWVNGPNPGDGPEMTGTMGVPSPNNVPGARAWGAVSWTDQQGHLWLHGGYGFDAFGDVGTLDDMWMYDIATNEWTWMQGSNTAGTTPVYGPLGVSSSTNSPGGRSECNTAWVKSDGTLWTWGGEDFAGDFYNDMWKFNVSTNQWTWVSGDQGGTINYSYGTLNVQSPSNLPPARGTYTRWQDGSDNYYIFGGANFNSSYSYNDVWKYNTSNNEWTWIGGDNTPNGLGTYTQLCTPGNNAEPAARIENRTAQMNGCSDIFWTFGGFSNSSGADAFNDLWNFNTQTNKWAWVSGSSSYNSAGNYGTVGVPAATNVPPAKGGVCLWVDRTGVVWMWGGPSNWPTMCDDMWRFVPDTACLHAALFITPLSAQLSDSAICSGGSAYLGISGGTIVSVTPITGSTTVDSSDVTFHPGSTTSYTVIAVGSCGILDTLHYTITVATPPIASVQFLDSLIYTGQMDSIINHSSGYDTMYAFLNGQPVYPVPSHLSFTQAGTYCLELIAANGPGCADTSVTCVVVKQDSCFPNITISLSPSPICPGDSSYLTVTGVSHFTVLPAGSVTPVDSNHAWLKPTASTTYQIIFNNLCGGLDTVLQTLNISSPSIANISRSICTGGSYTFGGQILTSPGTYRDTTEGVSGCDSITILTLSTGQYIYTSISQTICTGGSVTFGGHILTSAGQYNDTLAASGGCDSVITLTLSVVSVLMTNVSATICPGSSLLFGNQVLSTSGTYVDTLTSIGGCDSVVTLTLSIGTVLSGSTSQTICTGGSILFGGQLITTAGIYIDTVLTATGCDSVVTLTVSASSSIVSHISQNICSGDSIVFNNQTIGSAGVYTDTLVTASGCDSIISLTLNLSPRPTAGFFIVPVPAGDSVPLGTISVTDTSQNADTILWQLNNQVIALTINLDRSSTLPITDTGSYCIRLIAISDNGCRDTSQQCIYVFENAFAMPNAFTPNGDGKNDVFYPVFISSDSAAVVSFTIYNRWGQLVFDNPQQGWDGKYKGDQQPTGIYTYFITVQLPDIGDPSQMHQIRRQGTVTLMR